MIVTLPRVRDIDLKVTAPPSKSYTHRALIAGALARGTTVVHNPLDAEDTRLTLAALRALGVQANGQPGLIVLTGCSGVLPAAGPVTLDLDNSGTSLRLAHLARAPLPAPGHADRQRPDAGAADRPARKCPLAPRRFGPLPEEQRLPASRGFRDNSAAAA